MVNVLQHIHYALCAFDLVNKKGGFKNTKIYVTSFMDDPPDKLRSADFNLKIRSKNVDQKSR